MCTPRVLRVPNGVPEQFDGDCLNVRTSGTVEVKDNEGSLLPNQLVDGSDLEDNSLGKA